MQNISLKKYLTFKHDQQLLSFCKTIQIWGNKKQNKTNPSLIYKSLQFIFKGYQMFSISA